MSNNISANQDSNNTDYNNIINYLMKAINNQNVPQPRSEDKPIFLYEFFVFELYTPKEIFKTLKQPLLAFRLLDFPTQTIEGNINETKGTVLFNQGKSCFFEMEIHNLKECLTNEPLYVMFVDMNYGDMRILGSSRVNISIFAYDNFVQYSGHTPPQPRRNILKLFDNDATNVAEFEIALLIRREYFKYESNVNNFIRPKKEINIQDPFIVMKTKENPNDLDVLLKGGKINTTVKETKTLQTREEIIEELNNLKKEAAVNTVYSNQNNHDDININKIKPIPKQQDLINPSNPREYIKNIKELLDGKEKLPPPLFFHNKRNKEKNSSITVKIIKDEEQKVADKPDRLTEVIKNIENQKSQPPKEKPVNRDYVKIPSKLKNQTKNEILIIPREKPSYDKKMRTLTKENNINRYEAQNSSTSSKTSKNLKENENKKSEENNEDYNLENEYLNLYSKIKKTSDTKKDLIKIEEESKLNNKNNIKSIESYNDFKSQDIPSRKESIKSQLKDIVANKISQEIEDETKKYEKFYEISNTHQFELSSNQMIKSYNSISMSYANSNRLEIKTPEKFNILNKQVNNNNNNSPGNKKSSIKNVKFEDSIKTLIESDSNKENINSYRNQMTDMIEEDIVLRQSKETQKSLKALTHNEITEEYGDFDYDNIEENISNKNTHRLLTGKDEDEIEEEIIKIK